MKFHFMNSGLPVDAVFPDEDVENIYKPLLQRLLKLQEEKGKRILVMLAAPPGAGKSTLAAFLQDLSKKLPMKPITVIGMDGFHRYQDDLLSHFTERDGEVIPLVKIKGAPETFDLEKFTERVRQVVQGECCGWPAYDRTLHNPVENAVTVDGDIVLLEGNYLLLDLPGWRELSRYADYTVFLRADEELLRKRLIKRQEESGKTPEEARDFVEKSDLVNARLVLRHQKKADCEVFVRETPEEIQSEHFCFEVPGTDRKEDAIGYIGEFLKYGSEINGAGGLHRYLDDYEGWLRKLSEDYVREPNEEKVPARTFFLVRESDRRIVGMINIRLTLNEKLRRYGGHIGYSIRPTERGKGYNKINLYLGLKVCDRYGIDRVFLDADLENPASWKTMEALGGERIRAYYDAENAHCTVVDYNIDVKRALAEHPEYERNCAAGGGIPALSLT